MINIRDGTRSRFGALVAAWAVLFALGAGAASGEERGVRIFREWDATYIVRAAVTGGRVGNSPGPRGDFDLTITEVYRGPGSLAGRRFNVASGEAPNNGEMIEPLLRVGERGVWAVAEYDSELTLVRPPSLIIFPLREAYSDDLIADRKATDAVVRVLNARGDERIALLKEFAVHPLPDISAWATRALTELAYNDPAPPGLPELLRGLATEPRLGPIARMFLDQYLDDTDRAWDKSADRTSLFVGAAAAANLGVSAVKWIDYRLGSAFGSQAGDLPLRTVKALVTNKHLHGEAREAALHALVTLAIGGDSVEGGFELLLQYAQARETDLRRVAADAIKALPRLSAAQRDQLRAVLPRTNDPAVVEAILKVLADNVPDVGR